MLLTGLRLISLLMLVSMVGIRYIKVTWQVIDMKNVYETFEDDEFEKLKQVKGDRTWHDALLEEFGVSE